MDALWRIVALLWVGLAGYVLGAIVGILAIIWMVLDVLWQVVVGSEGLDPNGRVGSWLRGYISWTTDMTIYAITGAGSGFEWFPSSA